MYACANTVQALSFFMCLVAIVIAVKVNVKDCWTLLLPSDMRANLSLGMHSALSYSRNGFGGPGSVGFIVGLGDLKGLFQPK